jgi:transaldolase
MGVRRGLTHQRGAVFLDRDGVINEAIVREGKPHPPSSISAVVLAPNALAEIRRLQDCGYPVICVTNQPDVARGTLPASTAHAIMEHIASAVGLDDAFVCSHDDSDGCECRKPRPGLLLEAAARHAIDLSASFMVGDRWKDIDAGAAAGCKTILIDRQWPERRPAAEPDVVVSSLHAAVDSIVKGLPKMTMVSNATPMGSLQLKVKLFADGADRAGIEMLAANPAIAGFTTNPTLMRKAGITDYSSFAKDALSLIGGRPISFEVFADELDEMRRQAHVIAPWGDNVYVKIPVTNTKRQSCVPLIRELAADGIKVNVTALMTENQVETVAEALAVGPPSYISVFAGRVADTGRDPLPIMERSVSILKAYPQIELIWASPREILNLFQADAAGVHVITATHDILAKLPLLGKDLDDYSLETVQMFHRDATAAGFRL